MKILFLSLPKNILRGKILKPMFKSPPITHLWLAAVLLQNGHEVAILDALSLNLNIDQILTRIQLIKPDILGFTVFTSAYSDVILVANRIKELFPNILVAVGGYHVNSMYTDFFHESVDFIFVGEGEYGLLKLMNRLDRRDPSKENIPGLIYYDAALRIWKKNDRASLRTDFDTQPVLPYEMIIDNNYTAWWTTIDLKKQKYMATVTGKGCPMNCSFCDITKTEGPRYRAMSAERVLEELDYMTGLGITHIEFRDAFFTADMRRLQDIAEGIIRRRLDIQWGCSSTIKKIRQREILRLLYRSGCRFLFFGVESGNPEILFREKKVSPLEVYEAVNMVQQEGIQAHCSFIFGLEGETPETMRETVKMSHKLNCSSASYSIAIPYPGTRLFELYRKKGFLTTLNWEDYGGEEPVFETDKVSKTELVRFLKKAHRGFYFRPRYICRRLVGIRSSKELMNYVQIAARMLNDVTSYKR